MDEVLTSIFTQESHQPLESTSLIKPFTCRPLVSVARAREK